MGGARGGKRWNVVIVSYIPRRRNTKVAINIEKHLNGAEKPLRAFGDTCSFVDKHVKATIMSYAKSERSRYITIFYIKYFCWFY